MHINNLKWNASFWFHMFFPIRICFTFVKSLIKFWPCFPKKIGYETKVILEIS
jgi:hypothetical protein